MMAMEVIPVFLTWYGVYYFYAKLSGMFDIGWIALLTASLFNDTIRIFVSKNIKMEKQESTKIDKPYLLIVTGLMLVLPLVSIIIDWMIFKNQVSIIDLVGKWFVFWAVGIRLFTAGLRQSFNPSFTAKNIFFITDESSFVIVRELGFANICMGIIGVISVFIPSFRLAAAVSGGLYMGIAGVNHIIKKPSSPNEWLAMVSDVFIGMIMTIYIVGQI